MLSLSLSLCFCWHWVSEIRLLLWDLIETLQWIEVDISKAWHGTELMLSSHCFIYHPKVGVAGLIQIFIMSILSLVLVLDQYFLGINTSISVSLQFVWNVAFFVYVVDTYSLSPLLLLYVILWCLSLRTVLSRLGFTVSLLRLWLPPDFWLHHVRCLLKIPLMSPRFLIGYLTFLFVFSSSRKHHIHCDARHSKVLNIPNFRSE